MNKKEKQMQKQFNLFLFNFLMKNFLCLMYFFTSHFSYIYALLYYMFIKCVYTSRKLVNTVMMSTTFRN